MTEVRDHSSPEPETAVIRQIIAALSSGDDVTVPPGDDCAAVKPPPGTELVLTSDPVTKDVHFGSSATFRQVGHKAAGRVLSDLAAMGAEPRWLLLNIAAESGTAAADITAIVAAAQELAQAFDASVVGGDVSESGTLSVNAFACGILPEGCAVCRSGARPGDAIFVTGQLGNSSAGGHLSFTPRVAEGVWLRQHSFPSSMIDLSDGIASDLRHLLEASEAGARIILEDIPVHSSLSERPFRERVSKAMTDGEDFELLFTVDCGRIDELERKWGSSFSMELTRIGTIIEGPPEITAVAPDGTESRLRAKGFEHFA